MRALSAVVRLLTGEPVGASACRFHPSCSQYAADALRKYGLVRGSLKAAWRILRCNPWSHGGVDYA
jgi:putative membrane protein insertion efficiency factor